MNEIVAWLGELAVRGAEEAIGRYYERRKADASEELSEALRNANISLEEAIRNDDTIAMLHRWDRAWREGAAREKLKLLSRLLAGEIGRGPEGADEFQFFADIVLSLTHEERVFLASLYEAETKAALQKSDAEGALTLAMGNLRRSLVGEDRLLPNLDAFDSVGMALTRTGLLLARPIPDGGFDFPMMLKLQRLVDLTGLEEWATEALTKNA